jgi:hypothetical protein
VNRARARRRR